MRRLLTLLLIPAALVAAPTPAHAGTRAHTTCTESFARWHNDTPQPAGGYVTLDFGGDGVDYTTTVWTSAGTVGLGARYPGTTIVVAWHTSDGATVVTKGRGVTVLVDSCTPPTTPTTVPTTSVTVTLVSCVGPPCDPPTTAPGSACADGTCATLPPVETTSTAPGSACADGTCATLPPPATVPPTATPSTTRPSPDITLPETGRNVAGSLTVAIVLFVLGAAAIVATRRRR